MDATHVVLLVAVAFFLAIHFLVSGTRLRGILVGALGEGVYLGLFSLASAAGLAWVVWAYGAATTQPLWNSVGFRHLALVLMALAVPLAVGGLTAKNPTAARQEKAVGAAAAKGFVAITRHPLMTAIGLWALAHLLALGTVDGLVFFGGLLVLAWLGPLLIDAKRRRQDPARWGEFAARTSYAPFVALLQGRNRLSMKDLGWWRLGLSVALFAVFVWLHPEVIGPTVWPG
ncbi:MAG: NnrU family protein [Alphaproteobacteria bacterium]|nr:NnrU family protein [Alphaproteobacteria bacterium]